MNLLSVFDAPVRTDVPLAELTWFGLGGPARYWLSPSSVDELAAVWQHALEADIWVKVLGGGANVLVADDGFDGLVIRLDDPAFQAVEHDVGGDSGRVIAGGGADLMKLSRDCALRGLSGLECMGGIPGSVGGAVRMNAGGRFGAFGNAVRSATLIDASGQMRDASAAELNFGYRTANIGDAIVVAVELNLMPDSPDKVGRRFREVWEFKKASQPMADHSAGCTFKNPAGQSAGKLIDESGLKGRRRGGARVSERHANFIVADRGARADDVIALIDEVRDEVARRHGIELELEIDIWR